MEVIFGLSFLALLVVWVLTFIGLISPKRLQSLRKSKVLTRKDILIGSLIISIILFVVMGVTVPDPETNKSIKSPNQTVKEKISQPTAVVIPEISKEPLKEIKNEANLGMTPEEFRQHFNKRLNDLDVSSIRPLAEFNIEKGDVRDVFQVNFSDEINMTGTVNKDGMLREITFIVAPKENAEKVMMEALILIGSASHTVNPNGNKEKIGKAVMDLITKALKGFEKENNNYSQVIGDVKYYSLASKYTGLWFGMSPIKE